MRISHKLMLVGVGISALVATGSVAWAASASHDPNVVGGRFCVDYGTNTAHYDYQNRPCAANQYVDQNTYSIPDDSDLPPVVVNPQVTRTNKLVVAATNPDTYQVTIPSGATLNSVLAVTWASTTEISVPFTAQVTNAATGDVTLTFVGTPSVTPPAGQSIYVTYSYTPQG